jgi:Tol biopolymer transport system component
LIAKGIRPWGFLAVWVALLAGCSPSVEQEPELPSPSDALWQAATPADSLIREGEEHFSGLRQVTFGGENAEAYWSPNGTALIMQCTRPPDYQCDQILLYTPENITAGGELISSGEGRTTCAYFVGQERVLYASTHLGSPDCPPPADRSQGYVWPVYESYDIFVTALEPTGELERLTDTPGYDAEATLSPDGSTIVFTSLRDGDLDIYTMGVDGTDVTRLTDETGYDGGPFFSPDGEWICFRAYHPQDLEEINDYRSLLNDNLVRPGKMNLWVMRRDGSEKKQVTSLPGASFAPYFVPDGKRLIFASNQDNPRGPFFDLYLVHLDGTGLEKVTTEESFDGFPMFSPDGKYLAFSSNRGAKVEGETNVFLARWRE